jgi:hypothetical protein
MTNFQFNADNTAIVTTVTTVVTTEYPVVKPGQFTVGKTYTCVWANPKAKPGTNGNPRFKTGSNYTCYTNNLGTDTDNRPQTYLADDSFAMTNVGHDAKIKSMFIAAA